MAISLHEVGSHVETLQVQHGEGPDVELQDVARRLVDARAVLLTTPHPTG